MRSIISIISLSGIFIVGCGTSSEPPTEPTPDELLAGIVTAKTAETPELLARNKEKLAENLRLAREAKDKNELDRAIRLLEDAVMFDSKNRDVLLTLTQYTQIRSKELATEDPASSYRLMSQASAYLQMLRDAHSDFTDAEKKVIATILFDEACAHARSNRHEESSSALSAALAAGFDDVQRLSSDPDFVELRKLPQFASLLDSGIENAKKKTVAGSKQ